MKLASNTVFSGKQICWCRNLSPRAPTEDGTPVPQECSIATAIRDLIGSLLRLLQQRELRKEEEEEKRVGELFQRCLKEGAGGDQQTAVLHTNSLLHILIRRQVVNI